MDGDDPQEAPGTMSGTWERIKYMLVKNKTENMVSGPSRIPQSPDCQHLPRCCMWDPPDPTLALHSCVWQDTWIFLATSGENICHHGCKPWKPVQAACYSTGVAPALPELASSEKPHFSLLGQVDCGGRKRLGAEKVMAPVSGLMTSDPAGVQMPSDL